MRLHRLNLKVIVLALLTLLASVYAQPDAAVLRGLQNGGYVIYFRHAATAAESDHVSAAGD